MSCFTRIEPKIHLYQNFLDMIIGTNAIIHSQQASIWNAHRLNIYARPSFEDYVRFTVKRIEGSAAFKQLEQHMGWKVSRVRSPLKNKVM